VTNEIGASLLRATRADVLLAASRHPLMPRLAAGLESTAREGDETRLLLVSGGGDSMALLVACAAIGRRRGSRAEFAVLSIDHGLRAGSAQEVESVLATARDLGFERTFGRRVEIAPGTNVLDAARAARYEAAIELARALQGATLVVAHQADDRAESFLMALARREGLGACTKLLPWRAFPDWEGAEIARPLLGLTRAELRLFLRDCGVAWIEDPSNDAHRRGFLRSDPASRRLVGEIALGMADACDEAAELLALRDELVERALVSGRSEGEVPARMARSCRREAFDALPIAARRALLARLARAAGVSIARESLVAAAATASRTPRRWNCSHGSELRIGAETVEIARVGHPEVRCDEATARAGTRP
jgi:tRNA(Ile)-lysidine synthase